MASYLLKADDETMARWKKAAKDDDAPSFADWLRLAIEEKIERDVAQPYARSNARERVERARVTVPGSKEFKGPDPKSKSAPKEKKTHW